jgi:hypothetical protein
MECDQCGSRNVTRRDVEGHLLFECNLCGNLQGNDDAVARVEELRTGRERGLDDRVIPLVSALESSGVFRLQSASAGDPKRNEPPYVLLALTKSDTAWLERLLRSLAIANRETRLRWLVELTLQRGITCLLRPRFYKSPSDLTPEDLDAAQKDLLVLGRSFRRDLGLSWWRG